MGTIASQITSLTIVYSTVCSDADQRKHQSSASLAFVRGSHRGLVNSPHKWPVTRKIFPFDDVIMNFNKIRTHQITGQTLLNNGIYSIFHVKWSGQLWVVVICQASILLHWKQKQSILTTLASLVAPQVVITTTYRVVNDVKWTSFCFQCILHFHWDNHTILLPQLP